MKKILFAILLLFSSASYSSESPIKKFIAEAKSGKEIYTDFNYQDCKIIKIEHDLDDNGETDFLLSSYCPYDDNSGWGNAGGSWKVYFSSGKEFIEGVTLFFHPLAVQFEPTGVEKQFYYKAYYRTGCCSGTFFKNRVSLDTEKNIEAEDFENTNLGGSVAIEKYHKLFFDQKPIMPLNCTIKEIETSSCKWREGYY